MLQDLAYGRMENEYRSVQPTDDCTVVCFRDNRILLARDADDVLTLPTYAQVMAWKEQMDWHHWNDEPVQYAFRLQDVNYFIWMGEAGDSPDQAFAYEPVQGLRQSLKQLTSKNICFGAMTAWHLFLWYRDNRYCGRCSSYTVHDDKERMMRCPNCGNMIFPKIAPACIIAVTKGDYLLLSKYAGRNFTRFALIAGFIEIGETAEEAVAREVMEEVGLKVKNIRYYKTQPWGVVQDLLLGFYCDLDGDDNIQIDENELSMAGWYHRSDIPAKDDGISLTREMCRVFEEGKEPK